MHSTLDLSATETPTAFAPVAIAGHLYGGRKTANGRTRAAAETLPLIRPWFTLAGITRLANVTGLDRLGIPVVLAIRPGAQTLATNAGKGLTLEAAMVSAAMEGIEIHHAETVQPSVERRSCNELRRSGTGVVDPDRLPLRQAAFFNPEWPHDWLFGWDLLGDCRVAVPHSLVSLSYDYPSHDFRVFQSTSTGLASGNHLLEAILAGLLEVVERDAVTCHKHRYSRAQLSPPAIDQAGFTLPSLLHLLELLRREGVEATFFDCREASDLGIPVTKAYVVDRIHPEIGIYHGSAAALSSQDACLGALLEAIQSRAVYIAGSRDDTFQEEFRRRGDPGAIRGFSQALAAAPRLPVADIDMRTPTLEGDVNTVLRCLRGAGFSQAAAVTLTPLHAAVHVVKVIVPGLEGYLTPHYASGTRPERLLRERWSL